MLATASEVALEASMEHTSPESEHMSPELDTDKLDMADIDNLKSVVLRMVTTKDET
jgi:hypothetical protein